MNAELGNVAAAIAFAALACGCRNDVTSRLTLREVSRQSLTEEIELVQLLLARGTEPGGRAYLVYAEPEGVELGIELNSARSPLAKLASDALLTMNGAFFTPGYTPTGLLVSNGRQLHPFIKEAGGAGSGVVVLEDDVFELLERDAVGRRDFKSSRFALQAGPRIIEPGGAPGIRKSDGARAHRSIIGRARDGRLVLGVVLGPSGWGSGPSLYELQHVLIHESLGTSRLDFALNLDGGPSTGMYLRHPEHRVNEPESAAIYSYIVMRPVR